MAGQDVPLTAGLGRVLAAPLRARDDVPGTLGVHVGACTRCPRGTNPGTGWGRPLPPLPRSLLRAGSPLPGRLPSGILLHQGQCDLRDSTLSKSVNETQHILSPIDTVADG